MTRRLQVLGALLALIGLGFLIGGGVAYAKVQDGQDSLQAFSAAQNVELEYNEDGQLTDRGETAGADAIMSLLKDDWKYPVVDSELDPADPLVNTASEYMYQMATISYHTLNGETEVTVPEDVEYNGETFKAGTYPFVNDGRYWTGFDRMHPIEGAAREQLWSGTAHGLIGELGVGTVTAQALTMGLALSGLLAGIGATFLLVGLGLVWAGATKKTMLEAPAIERISEPAKI